MISVSVSSYSGKKYSVCTSSETPVSVPGISGDVSVCFVSVVLSDVSGSFPVVSEVDPCSVCGGAVSCGCPVSFSSGFPVCPVSRS